jgi:hypothetical protein
MKAPPSLRIRHSGFTGHWQLVIRYFPPIRPIPAEPDMIRPMNKIQMQHQIQIIQEFAAGKLVAFALRSRARKGPKIPTEKLIARVQEKLWGSCPPEYAHLQSASIRSNPAESGL